MTQNAEQQLHFYVFSLLDQFILYVGSYLVLILVWWEGKTSTAAVYCKLLVQLMCSVLFCLTVLQQASWTVWGPVCQLESMETWIDTPHGPVPSVQYRQVEASLQAPPSHFSNSCIYMGCVASI